MASGRTLYEIDEKKPLGFFPKLYESLVKSLSEEDSQNLNNIRDEPEKLIRFIYDMDNFKKSLAIVESYPEKNPYESKIKKEYGNKAYQEGKDIDALFLYTQSVIAAPCDENGCSKELSVALANRSAVLFSLKAYGMALDDIKLAFESGYPKELRFKLLERKAKILAFFKQHDSARDTYRELLKSLDVAKVESEKKFKLQKEAQLMLDFYDKAKSVYNAPNVAYKTPRELPKIEDKNPKFPAIANCLNFKHEPGRGRFAVATRDIDVGEFVCVEEPLVSRILPEFSGSNCETCFRAMKAPMPCPVCSKAMFCSYDCRKVALETFHKLECKIIEFLEASGMSIICFLAFRAITKKPKTFFLENKDKFQGYDDTAGSVKSKVTKHLSSDYRNLYNLVTHHDERKIGDIFHRGMFTVMLLRCLKKSGYFGPERRDISNPDSDSLTEEELYIGTLLYHFLEVLQFNSHEVAQFEMITKNREEGATSNFIGAAIYPTLALFNHSCDPSIVRFYVEDVVCVQAIKNIKKGEEICENYGPIFFHSDRDDRQDRLKKQYWFDCQCIPCQENWPLMHEMTDESLNFRCSDCNGSVKFSTHNTNPLLRCVCGTPVPMLQALKKISETEMISEKAKKAMESGDLAEAQNLYCDYLMTLDKYLVPPYQDYYKIQQSIWKCIWMRFGNRVVKSKVRKPLPVALQYDDTVD